jgi:four helix bundle protein
MATYNHFYELPVYKTCRAFRKKVSVIARNNFPRPEQFFANIAEGFGRFHHQENIQFTRQSRGSLSETCEHMITAYDDKYITKSVLTEINKDYKECLRQLNG